MNIAPPHFNGGSRDAVLVLDMPTTVEIVM